MNLDHQVGWGFLWDSPVLLIDETLLVFTRTATMRMWAHRYPDRRWRPHAVCVLPDPIPDTMLSTMGLA